MVQVHINFITVRVLFVSTFPQDVNNLLNVYFNQRIVWYPIYVTLFNLEASMS